MPPTDFDPQQQLKKVHDVIEHPDKFSEVFCTALASQVKMREDLFKVMLQLLRSDIDSRKELKTIIREVEKEDVRFVLKKIGFGGWTFFIFVAGVVITKIIESFFK